MRYSPKERSHLLSEIILIVEPPLIDNMFGREAQNGVIDSAVISDCSFTFYIFPNVAGSWVC